MDLRGEMDSRFFYADSIQLTAKETRGLYVLVAYVKEYSLKI
jgi:hypothetical protein